MSNEDPYDNKPEQSHVDHAGNAKVQRVVWEDGPFIFKTEWMNHYDLVRELYDEKRTAMPGANVRLQMADVETVTNIRDMDFYGEEDTDAND